MQDKKTIPCQSKEYFVSSDTFPIVCPPLEERIWDAHPRIYLTLNEEGYIDCPYCGTKFVAKDK